MRESHISSLVVATPEAMRELGNRIGRMLLEYQGPALCIAIEGELGAGKTTFVSGVLGSAGVRGPVRSPTYTLIEPYELAGRSLYHLDLYRLTDPSEIEPLGLRDLLTPGSILLIEWPSRAEGRIPPPDLALAIQYLDPPQDGRRVRITPGSPEVAELLRRLLR